MPKALLINIKYLITMTIPLELKEKIKQVSNLPTLPHAACLIMDRINNPKTSSSDIASIVSQDVSLTAKILRLANSAYYGIPRTIANINEAIVILGFRVIYTVVLSQTVFDMFPDHKLSIKFNRKKFWKHCVTCAILSKLIAGTITIRKTEPENSFCAGLLHDIGKIVMEQYLHDDMHRAIDYSIKSGIPFFRAEAELLGYAHTDVAEWLISRWNLPDLLYKPIIYHHSPGQIIQNHSKQSIQPPEINTCICHISDYLCFSEEISENKADSAQPPLDTGTLSILGFTKRKFELLKKQLPEVMENMESFYDILFT